MVVGFIMTWSTWETFIWVARFKIFEHVTKHDSVWGCRFIGLHPHFLVACYARLHPALLVHPSARPSNLTFSAFLFFFPALLLLSKCSTDLKYGPPPRDWGNRVSGLGLAIFYHHWPVIPIALHPVSIGPIKPSINDPASDHVPSVIWCIGKNPAANFFSCGDSFSEKKFKNHTWTSNICGCSSNRQTIMKFYRQKSQTKISLDFFSEMD